VLTRTLVASVLLAALAPLSAAPPADAPAPTAECPAPVCVAEVQKVAVPAVVTKKHTKVCYDCKEEDYTTTRCLRTPILSTKCHPGTCGCAAGEAEVGCVKCGPVRTRKVLIKKIITEEVPVPGCKVESVPVGDGSGPHVEAGPGRRSGPP
jgi:hypothetical protein